MLTVVLIWTYVTAVSGILGYGILRFLCSLPLLNSKRSGRESFYRVRYRENYIVTGIVFLTVYAQIWSLFGGVGLFANIVLVLLCAALLLRFFGDAGMRGFSYLIFLFSRKYTWIYILLFFLFAYGTSHGLAHYDTGLYHAQAIRWIEEYGAARGLGNLHTRLAYNSAAFPLSALFSFAFLGQSTHTMAGYFALLLAVKCVDLLQIGERRHPGLPDGARLVAIYYLYTIFNDMVSPASDYFVLTIILYILITWLDLSLVHERSSAPYAFIAMLSVYAVTIKLSAAPLLLLTIKPITMILSEKEITRSIKWKRILFYILGSLAVALPYLVRNVILSGWLLYPSTAIDLFSFDWKIPKEIADYDAYEISVYGRGFTDVSRYSEPFTQWFPGWFAGIGRFNQGMLLLDMLALVVYAVMLVIYIIAWGKRKSHLLRRTRLWQHWTVGGEVQERQREQASRGKIIHLSKKRMVKLGDFLFIETVLYVQLFFWLFSSPLIRYGSLFLLLPGPLMLYRVFTFFFYRMEERKEHMWGSILITCIMLFVAYKSVRLVADDVRIFDLRNLVWQQAYESYECEAYEIDGLTFYHPVEGDRAGYDPFPSTPVIQEVQLRGTGLEDGFRAVEE